MVNIKKDQYQHISTLLCINYYINYKKTIINVRCHIILGGSQNRATPKSSISRWIFHRGNLRHRLRARPTAWRAVAPDADLGGGPGEELEDLTSDELIAKGIGKGIGILMGITIGNRLYYYIT